MVHIPYEVPAVETRQDLTKGTASFVFILDFQAVDSKAPYCQISYQSARLHSDACFYCSEAHARQHTCRETATLWKGLAKGQIPDLISQGSALWFSRRLTAVPMDGLAMHD